MNGSYSHCVLHMIFKLLINVCNALSLHPVEVVTFHCSVPCSEVATFHCSIAVSDGCRNYCSVAVSWGMGERAGMIERAVMIVERGLLSIMPRGVGLQRGGSEPNLTGNSLSKT